MVKCNKILSYHSLPKYVTLNIPVCLWSSHTGLFRNNFPFLLNKLSPLLFLRHKCLPLAKASLDVYVTSFCYLSLFNFLMHVTMSVCLLFIHIYMPGLPGYITIFWWKNSITSLICLDTWIVQFLTQIHGVIFRKLLFLGWHPCLID